MLKQRLITAAVLIPLVVWGILSLSNFYFAVVLTVLVATAAWEWAGLIGLPAPVGRAVYVLLILVALWLSSWIPVVAVLSLAMIGWLIGLVWVLRYPAGDQQWANRPIGALAGVFVLVAPWVALVALHGGDSMGPYRVLFLLSLIWLADTAAYFAGRRWGAAKLAPRVSPGKTWAGAWGALVAGAVYALLSGMLVFTEVLLPVWVLLAVTAVLFSILGDLLESMFKRQAGVKDSGSLLPGHGGMLDRIDSLTAAAPLFMLGMLLINKGFS
ncbi:MAG TPA: phosphatidate cytidylyltransferase [Gammaproteobacteria bacterium]|nr:phosphatidate cytidylyltransferase [Gammaproteobacteria bacterium]